MIADRLYYSNQQFARKLAGHHLNIAERLVDTLIEKKAMSTSVDRWSVTLHSFDTSKYRAVVKELIQTNAICQRAKDAGPQFWEVFTSLGDAESPRS